MLIRSCPCMSNTGPTGGLNVNLKFGKRDNRQSNAAPASLLPKGKKLIYFYRFKYRSRILLYAKTTHSMDRYLLHFLDAKNTLNEISSALFGEGGNMRPQWIKQWVQIEGGSAAILTRVLHLGLEMWDWAFGNTYTEGTSSPEEKLFFPSSHFLEIWSISCSETVQPLSKVTISCSNCAVCFYTLK